MTIIGHKKHCAGELDRSMVNRLKIGMDQTRSEREKLEKGQGLQIRSPGVFSAGSWDEVVGSFDEAFDSFDEALSSFLEIYIGQFSAKSGPGPAQCIK